MHGYNADSADLPNAVLTHNGKNDADQPGADAAARRHDRQCSPVSGATRFPSPKKSARLSWVMSIGTATTCTDPGDRILDAISAVGGYTQQADLSKINVIHTDRVRRTSQLVRVNLNSYLLRNDPTGNPLIQPGDALYIPDKKHNISFGDIINTLSGAGSAVYGARALTGQ